MAQARKTAWTGARSGFFCGIHGVFSAAAALTLAAAGALAQGAAPPDLGSGLRSSGAIDYDAFARFRPETQSGAAAPQAQSSGDPLPVTLPVLGLGAAGGAEAQAAIGPAAPSSTPEYSYDETGAWYGQRIETGYGPVLIQGDRYELAFDAPAMEQAAAAATQSAPATPDAPSFDYGGDEFAAVFTEVTASFETGGVNYMVTLACDPDGPFPRACEDETAIREILQQLRLLQ